MCMYIYVYLCISLYMHVYVCMPKMSKVRAGRVSHPHASTQKFKYHPQLAPAPPHRPPAPSPANRQTLNTQLSEQKLSA